MATIDLTNDSDDGEEAQSPSTFKFLVPGKPNAMPRSRFYHKGFYNSKKPQLNYFRSQVLFQLPPNTNGVIFKKGTPLQMTIKFYLRRPDSDFKRGVRCEANLKAWARSTTLVTIAPDVDNLSKFVMDACNSLLYHDDRQVVFLKSYKGRDNLGSCEGRTMLQVSVAEEEVDPDN